MKKLFVAICLLFMALCMVFPLTALAEGTTDTTQAYDWARLLTIPGAIAATLLVVQYAKLPLDKVWKIPTRWVVLIIAFAIMFAAKYFTQSLTLADIPLTVINSFVVSLAAMGAYEVSFGKTTKQ